MTSNQFVVELRTYIARHFIKQSNYAKEIGVTPAFVSYVLQGKKSPNERMLNDLGLKMNKETIITFSKA